MCVWLSRSYRRGTELKQRNTPKALPQKLSQCKRVIGRYFSAKNANPHSVSRRGLANKRPAENLLWRCCSADKSQKGHYLEVREVFIAKSHNTIFMSYAVVYSFTRLNRHQSLSRTHHSQCDDRDEWFASSSIPTAGSYG